MKAILRTGYGSQDALQLKELEKPTPTDNQVLIKVHAASINAYDGHFLRGPFLLRISGAGFRKPKDPRLGVDLAGRVEAVGSKVTQFKVGDEVFGEGEGAFAEYACAREDALILKPGTMAFEEAAALPMAAVTALQGLRDTGQLQAGQKVLIYGASGGVGSFAVQLGRYLGAQVTCPGYLDYPFQNECFGHSSLAHFSYLPRLIFSKTPIFRTDDTCSQDRSAPFCQAVSSSRSRWARSFVWHRHLQAFPFPSCCWVRASGGPSSDWRCLGSSAHR